MSGDGLWHAPTRGEIQETIRQLRCDRAAKKKEEEALAKKEALKKAKRLKKKALKLKKVVKECEGSLGTQEGRSQEA